MNILTKNLLGGAVVASLALAGAVIADETVKHQTIDINVATGQEVQVKVGSQHGTQTLMFSQDELQDKDVLESKLADLDPQTRETVMQALENIGHTSAGKGHIVEERVFVLNKGDGEHVKILHSDGEDVDIEFSGDGKRKMIRKHIVHGDGDMEFRVLKGHTDAITKMIEKGEFSRDELDKIQAALDAKR